MGMNYEGVYFAKIANDREPGYRNRIAWSSVDEGQSRYMKDWFSETRERLVAVIPRQVLPAIQQNARKQFNRIQDLTASTGPTPQSVTFTDSGNLVPKTT